MNSILLLNPPKILFGKKNIWNTIKESSLPIGLTHLAAFIKALGIKVNIIDLRVQEFSEEDLVKHILNLSPDFVGLTATTVQIKSGLKIAKIIKEKNPDIKIVFGGVHSTVLPDEILANDFVDFVVRGEGEQTIAELLSGKPISDIDGLSYKINGCIMHNKERQLITDIDALPYPAYELLDLSRYKPTLGNFKQLPSMSMITSRGCPGTCTFCYSGAMGKRIRFLSAPRIFNQIKFLNREYGIRDINFYDDTFTANKANIFNLCNILRAEKLGLTWSCMSRLDCISEELLKKMHEAGCHQIGYGIESSSRQILENIKKRMPIDRVKEIVDITKKTGIDVRAMFMLGNPGETEETMENTIKFAESLNADIYLFNVTTPYPGTEMFFWANQNGYLTTKNWDDYDLYHYVMKLPTVDNNIIEKYYKSAYKKCYLRPTYIIKRLKKINSWNSLKMHLQMVPYLFKS